MNKNILVKTLGSLSVYIDGQKVPLPASKKTRALLAYLMVSGRTLRREYLCELLWGSTDDPRGALRWALSKLRIALQQEHKNVLIADRERVQISSDDIDVDLFGLKQRINSKTEVLTAEQLKRAAEELDNELLAGIDLPNQPRFQAWLVAEREDIQLLKLAVIKKLTHSRELNDQESLLWARRWFSLEPLNEEATLAYVAALKKIGKIEEANNVISEFTLGLARAGLPPTTLLTKSRPLPASGPERVDEDQLRRQTIKFCTSSDGVRLAYATVGEGKPLVKAANWLNHLELDWGSPIWGDSFSALSSDRTLIRYDERGNGLSDWDVQEINQAMFVRDLESVVDELKLTKFPLLGISQGCAVSVEYAVRYPEKVSALILVSGYASGWRIGASAEEREQREAVLTLTKHGWGSKNPAYRRIFSQTFMPDATPSELDWFDEFQRQTTSADNAVKFQEAFGEIDVRDLLDQVTVPTIVFHSRYDQRISLEQGRELAINIPNARFVPLDSKNHILLGHEPAWQTFIEETKRFLAEHRI